VEFYIKQNKSEKSNNVRTWNFQTSTTKRCFLLLCRHLPTIYLLTLHSCFSFP